MTFSPCLRYDKLTASITAVVDEILVWTVVVGSGNRGPETLTLLPVQFKDVLSLGKCRKQHLPFA